MDTNYNEELTTIREINQQFSPSAVYGVILKTVMYFNEFERYILKGKSGNWETLEDVSLNKKEIVSPEVVNHFIDFFVERYLREDNTLKDSFSDLFGSSNHRRKGYEEVKKYLNRNYQTANSKEENLSMALMIAYRFRDNLYHGNKKIRELSQYQECFEQVNQFMDAVIEQILTSEESQSCHP